jgi:hypothetical protein
MNYTVNRQAIEELSERMTALMKQVTQSLGEEALAEQRTLAELEEQVLHQIKGIGNELLAGLCSLSVPAYPAAVVECSCGGKAAYQRQRGGQSKTLVGVVQLRRPYYLCAECHQGCYPLDEALGFCAGGMSAGLQAVMALLGVQFPFEEAALMLEKLTLVQVSPNACRKATETLGAFVVEQEQAAVQTAWTKLSVAESSRSEAIAGDFYISMDGVTVHIAEQGWKNLWLGAVYTTKRTPSAKRPATLEVRTEQPSFVTDLADVATFGRQLWLEAERRGLAQAQQVIVIGDGAHWLWKMAEEHFPQATQILDWYHAATYVWKAAHLLYGEGTDLAKHWVKQHLDLLWNGDVPTVLAHLQAQTAHKPALGDIVTYFRNNQQRMRYDFYRANGWQIGSGTIESGCKHVIGARLKQAGMIWSPAGAQAVAKLRARLKSRRWNHTVAALPPPSRTYHRHAA